MGEGRRRSPKRSRSNTGADRRKTGQRERRRKATGQRGTPDSKGGDEEAASRNPGKPTELARGRPGKASREESAHAANWRVWTLGDPGRRPNGGKGAEARVGEGPSRQGQGANGEVSLPEWQACRDWERLGGGMDGRGEG